MAVPSSKSYLATAVAIEANQAGFSTAQECVIEILTIMLQSLISEAGRSSQMLAEHNGRTEVTFNDVYLALVELGINADSIIDYGKKRNLIRLPAPGREQPQKLPTILQAGQSRPLHSYIPNYFPAFPSPHSYVRTPTHKQPITEYEVIRDKAASQKRDLERALTRFVAKTCQSDTEHCLFANHTTLNKIFPLISIQQTPLPFLEALLPKDQIFDDEDEEESND